MFEFDFSEVADPTFSSVTPEKVSNEPGGGQAPPAEPRIELVPGVDVSNMTVPEFLAASRPAPEWLLASAFGHLTSPDDLGRALFDAQGRYNPYDLEFQALIFTAIGTFYGDLIAERLAPTPNVPVPKPKLRPRKRKPKGKQPHFPNLVSLANELAAVRED